MALLPFTSTAILLLLCIPFVCALPPFNRTSAPTLDVTDSPSSSCNRTLWDIIWSCAATIFACTWTIVHPNIPGMYEGRIAVCSHRLFIMVLALIAPELMITWAILQFLSAREATKAFNDAFGAQARSDHPESTVELLSGFAPSDGRTSPHPSTAYISGRDFGGCGKPRATLTPEELMRFIYEGSLDVPDIEEAEIESRGDGLSKGIAVLQLWWFVLQLVARYIRHLPITLLEVDTLAIVSLACIAYCLWWKKPKDIQRPHHVHWKATAPPPSALYYEKANQEFALNSWHDYLIIPSYPLKSLMGIAVTISPRVVRERRIPSLGGYKDNPHDYKQVITLLSGFFSAVVYGGAHFLGWNYLFQWHMEQMLWRAVSIFMISASVSLPIFGCLISLRILLSDSWVTKFALVTIAFIYIATRVIVIVLITLSLRSLPPGAYDTVAWTTFIPHI
ncbi:hypothetical protein BD769DRAFT_1469617 [Suillus cothurnatus]|nr:hypothetical protein BD769DRAFT_1469617 [Suillus cothurnatus]